MGKNKKLSWFVGPGSFPRKFFPKGFLFWYLTRPEAAVIKIKKKTSEENYARLIRTLNRTRQRLMAGLKDIRGETTSLAFGLPVQISYGGPTVHFI